MIFCIPYQDILHLLGCKYKYNDQECETKNFIGYNNTRSKYKKIVPHDIMLVEM